MNIEQFSKLSRVEVSAFLKSSANLKAGEALRLIQRGASVAELESVVATGCSVLYWTRSEKNPRKAFLPVSLVDACANGSGEIEVKNSDVTDGPVRIYRSEIGPDARPQNLSVQNANRVACMRFLLAKGFPPGSNGWRGDFIGFLVSRRVRGEGGPFVQALADVAVEHLKSEGVPVLRMATEYEWTSSPESFALYQSFGGRDFDELLGVSLRYLGCAENVRSTRASRLDVIRRLIALGAKAPIAILADTRFNVGLGSSEARALLKTAGLLSLIHPSPPDNASATATQPDKRAGALREIFSNDAFIEFLDTYTKNLDSDLTALGAMHGPERELAAATFRAKRVFLHEALFRGNLSVLEAAFPRSAAVAG